ncbi:DUF222 domain-containing protein [Mycobacterium haemophilum DSM 44634]|nr:DUF222 domain-containing protein [Mycobacterium haemophilum DSM 44634]
MRWMLRLMGWSRWILMRCAPGSGWLLERVERVRRRIPAVEHPMINQLARQATPEELGGRLSHAIAEWTLISRAEAARRIREAADLGPRRGLTG